VPSASDKTVHVPLEHGPIALAASGSSREAVFMVQVAGTPIGELELADAARLSSDEVLSRLGTSFVGLSSRDAAERLQQFGPNALSTHEVRATAVLWRQIRNPILILLLGAALVSGLTGGGTNAVIIAVIVALSVGLGFLNEYRAEVAMDSLRGKIRHEAEVLRDGETCRVPVANLVPGDVVSLRIGVLVPADLRLVKVDELECDEGVLTGESMPVVKSVPAVTDRQGMDQPGCAFMGTIVHQGTAVGVVVQSGARTAFGQIAAGLSEKQGQTAFEVGLSRFSRFLFGVAAVLTAFIFIANVALSRPLIDALLFSLAIAVGIAPEMMPAIVTVSLSSGSRALAAKKVLVKRLVAIEDLGNIEILFTDKTGTLTEGVITFEQGLDAEGQESDTPLLLGLVCNEATIGEEGPVGGNALDQALWSCPGATKGGSARVAAYERLGVLPFDHERQLCSVLVKDPAGNSLVITKGAPEVVMDRCIDVPVGARLTLEALFSEGKRVVALATRPAASTQGLTPKDELGLSLVGFLTFADRPKADAGASIAQLERLGVDVKIITGDNGLVASKVCSEIGVDCTGVLSGAQVEELDDDELETAILTTTVFARISPDQKSRIIKVARRTGKDVAFLGDGVNDAVALHHADVGISVDSGTDVAKDAADVVLLDKDLGVLAEGVMEGRRIFANTMKYVLMSTSSNFGNMFSAAGASVFLSFLPMLPTQILLNNLLYNAGQLVIPTDRVDPEALARPAAWDMKFIRRFMSVFGPVSSIFDFLTFWVMLSILHAGHTEFRTGWFVESIATQTLVIYVIRTRRVPFFKSRPSLPMLFVPTGAALVGAILPYTGLAHLLGFTPLPTSFFLLLFGMVVVYLLLVELAKTRFYRAPHARTPRIPSTHTDRLERRIRRRASRFIRFAVQEVESRGGAKGHAPSTTSVDKPSIKDRFNPT
jgi:P-type Mg2+ transporter